MTAKITTGKSKTRKIEQSNRPKIFSGLVIKFVIRKKHRTSRFYGGMVSKSWVKQLPVASKSREFDWIWKAFRLVRRVRNDNKSQGKAGLAPRVILVYMKPHPERVRWGGVLWQNRCMFAGNDYTAIKSSAIDSAWTEVRSKFLFCAKSHPNHEIRSFQSGGSEIP